MRASVFVAFFLIELARVPECLSYWLPGRLFFFPAPTPSLFFVSLFLSAVQQLFIVASSFLTGFLTLLPYSLSLCRRDGRFVLGWRQESRADRFPRLWLVFDDVIVRQRPISDCETRTSGFRASVCFLFHSDSLRKRGGNGASYAGFTRLLLVVDDVITL